jgi:hypothetical protein
VIKEDAIESVPINNSWSPPENVKSSMQTAKPLSISTFNTAVAKIAASSFEFASVTKK